MRLKLFKNEDGSDVFCMRLSCKKHDDHFLVVCCLQGSYRALWSSVEVPGRFYMFLVCFGFLSRSLEAAVPGKFWPRSKSFGSLDLLLSS